MKNFNDLITKYPISIPIIQRDYVQGRNNQKAKEVRDNFLESIYKSLENNKVLNLDFIYGSVKNNKFIPLDGQQRLTTLYLLYFYFGKKEQKDISYLRNFSYETRASSREFCQKLIETNIDFTKETISKQIKNSHWFLPYWENDPTIKSMFIMLDSIHKKFKNRKYFNSLHYIKFQVFMLEEFGLDDDLYIKMNARGKPLTPFENFKASFEAFLENVDIDLKNEFVSKIDQKWVDVFWDFKNKNYLIDEAFMNYFYYITQMLYIKENKISKEPQTEELQSKIDQIYQKRENIKFLFYSIDNLNSILQSFNKIFSTNGYQKEKVALFSNSINLTKRVLEGKNINIIEKVLLFTTIQYLVKYKNVTNNLKDIIRVIRNLLLRVRGLKQGKLSYTLNLSYESLNAILKIIDTIIDRDIYKDIPTTEINLENSSIKQESLEQEIDKAKLINSNSQFKELIFELEDFNQLKGDIKNFLNEDISKFQKYKNAVIDIYSNYNDTKIIQAMLTSGDYKLKSGSAYGSPKYFFGKKGYWEIILTSDKKEFFQNFLDSYIRHQNSLDKMKKNFLENCNKKNWRYYFIKYNEMVETEDKFSKDNNIYAWFDDYNILKMGGFTISAPHINPYIRTLAIKNGIKYSLAKDANSYLTLNNKIKKIYSTRKGWEIHFSSSIDSSIKNSLIKNYNLEEQNNAHILPILEKEDRIEKISNFINDLNRSIDI